MKILFIIPGSGESFYCGNCLRDNMQASALRKAGHEVVLMPLYLPFRHAVYKTDTPLFFPATTFYLAQKFFGKRKMPSWLRKISDSDRMLKMASSLSGTTSAEGMESMTMAMITGDDPAFREQVQQMIDWIKGSEKFDVIQLSSSLLLGIARAIQEQLDIPIVCSLQDEEVWIDSMKKKEALLAWQAIRENNRYISRFLTTSEFYRNVIVKRFPEIKDQTSVVYPGVNRTKYNTSSFPDVPVIGYFNRMNKAGGLDILAEAFIKLKKKNSIPKLRLSIGGGSTGIDKAFILKVKQMLAPWKDSVDFEEKYDPDNHAAFYSSITVLSVPITFDESTGLYICESFAAGRPVVEPSSGSFREIVGDAGVIYEPNNSDKLAEALEMILTDKQLFNNCRAGALSLSVSRYSDTAQAEKIIRIYNNIINKV